jgi:hypothetical protein
MPRTDSTPCSDQARRLRSLRDAWLLRSARANALDLLESINDAGGDFAHPADCSCPSCRAIAKRRNQRAVA